MYQIIQNERTLQQTTHILIMKKLSVRSLFHTRIIAAILHIGRDRFMTVLRSPFRQIHQHRNGPLPAKTRAIIIPCRIKCTLIKIRL